MDSTNLIEIFVTETNTFLNTLETILLTCEKSGNSIRESTNEIFRIMHTIKSSSAMMSLDNISKLTHKLEDLFAYIREHNPADIDDKILINIVLDSVDFIKRNMDGVINEDPAKMIAYISKVLDDIRLGKIPSEPEPVKQSELIKSKLEDYNMDIIIIFKTDTPMIGVRASEIQNRLEELCDKLLPIPEDAVNNEEYIKEHGFRMLVKTSHNRDEIRMTFAKLPIIDDYKVKPLIPEPPKSAQDIFAERKTDRVRSGTYANVEITKLDNLVNLVSELLITQMEIADNLGQRDYDKGVTSVANLKKLILSLQEATLSTRMVSVRETFMMMNRIVRDMSHSLNKEINFTIFGESTEVDRSIIENLSSPLMHIVRNSVDHGIESADTRLLLGKPSIGSIELKAYNEGRNVIITVTDDGRGFDADRILNQAIANGVITGAEAGTLSEEDIYSLVFTPGFTTNDQVTEYSGRGVGMDVVNENVKKMNGKVSITSRKDKGSKITLKIPLTLAIIDTLILNVGNETCAIPVSSVTEICGVNADTDIRNVNGEDMILWRNECCRILNLYDYYTNCEPIPYTDGVMIIMGDGAKPYAVFAGSIDDRQDIVVKPAPELFKAVKGVAGCTILGSGRISLILDTSELLSSLNRKRNLNNE